MISSLLNTNLELCSRTVFVVGGEDGSVVSFDDAMDDRKTQTGAVGFGREKWVEDAIERGGIDAATGVAHDQMKLPGVGIRRRRGAVNAQLTAGFPHRV